MSVTEKTKIGTIDLTPTWAQQVEICIVLIENGTTEQARQTAREELRRMGKLLDQHQQPKES